MGGTFKAWQSCHLFTYLCAGSQWAGASVFAFIPTGNVVSSSLVLGVLGLWKEIEKAHTKMRKRNTLSTICTPELVVLTSIMSV